MDLRVAQIVKIERHPKADKLYIETLKISPTSFGSDASKGSEDSDEERVIVSGLVPYYKEEELLNKKIILAYNLKPAKLRGVESRGMLLAADDEQPGGGGKRVEVLDAGDAPIGTRVQIEGMELCDVPEEIDIDTFFSIPMEVKDHTVLSGGKALTLEGKPIKTKIIAYGGVH
jgi:methionyl-tRNA synthetase